MITEEEYMKYFGVGTTPINFTRLEYLSLHAIKSIMVSQVPLKTCPCYDDFKKAVMEQINFYDLNPDLITNDSSSGYTLGSYSESPSSPKDITKILERVSPIAYDILSNCGLLHSGLGGYCYGKV